MNVLHSRGGGLARVLMWQSQAPMLQGRYKLEPLFCVILFSMNVYVFKFQIISVFLHKNQNIELKIQIKKATPRIRALYFMNISGGLESK